MYSQVQQDVGEIYDHLRDLSNWTEEVKRIVNGTLGSRPKQERVWLVLSNAQLKDYAARAPT